MATQVKKIAKPAHPQKPTPRPRPGLGRGLGALLGTSAEPPAATVEPVAATPDPAPEPPPAAEPVAAPGSGSILRVAVDQIARSPWQPRHVFEAAALQELADSIKAHGVIQPLLCRRATAPATGYELIAGERRLRAAIDAGLAEVPLILVDAPDRQAAEMAIVENIQREDLNVIEEAEGYRSLAEHFGLTQQEVADRVGKGRASVANALRLLELPDEVKQLLATGMLSAGHAKVLLSLPDEKEQTLLARRCVTEGQTVRALERLIQRRQTEKLDAAAKQSDIPESHLRYLLERLHARLETQIRLQPTVTHANGKRTKGCIEIDFFDNADLDRLLGLIGVQVE
jgi:ParB family chromosome partitioning protein